MQLKVMMPEICQVIYMYLYLLRGGPVTPIDIVQF